MSHGIGSDGRWLSDGSQMSHTLVTFESNPVVFLTILLWRVTSCFFAHWMVVEMLL